jgi:hypothetical protein
MILNSEEDSDRHIKGYRGEMAAPVKAWKLLKSSTVI